MQDESWHDHGHGLEIRRVVREAATTVTVAQTTVVRAACRNLHDVGQARPEHRFPVAIKRWPREVTSPADIERRVRFAQVHVREPATDRIRLYLDVTPVDLARMTCRLLPYCPPA